MPNTNDPGTHDVVEAELSRSAEKRWGPFALTVMTGWLLLLAFAAGIGALITGPLVGTDFIKWDQNVPVDLEAARTGTGESLSQVGSGMGETLTVVGVAVAIGVVLLIARRWASVLLLATALLAEVSVFVVTTILIPRDRPDVEQLDVSPPTSSFPSGHTAAATTLALTLALLVGWNTRSRAARWLAWGLAVFVGPVVAFSRVYRGMHHPTDVFVGLLIGVACATIAFFAVRVWMGSSGNRDGVRGSHSIEETVR